MVTQSSNVCVVGSFSLDNISIVGHGTHFHNLGGATTYTSLAVKTLEETVSVVSRVGGDFPEAHLERLRKEGIDVSIVKRYQQDTTTHFDLSYNSDFSERTLKLTCKGHPISPADIPKDLRAKVIHVAPIANEISCETMQHLRQCCDVLSLDPQGFLRRFDENGNVTPKVQVDLQVLELTNICKLSQAELFVLTRKSVLKEAIRGVHDCGVETVIVTMGAKGSLLSVEGTSYMIPACQPKVLVDPTGAGDVFIGAFLVEYLTGCEPLWCASVGSAVASVVVEGMGSTFFGEKREILKRATMLYEKELK